MAPWSAWSLFKARVVWFLIRRCFEDDYFRKELPFFSCYTFIVCLHAISIGAGAVLSLSLVFFLVGKNRSFLLVSFIILDSFFGCL